MQCSTIYASALNFVSLACGCVQTFAKRLYRFMRRAMTRWPEQQPIGPLINLYLVYIAPWSVHTLSLPHPTYSNVAADYKLSPVRIN